MSHFTVLVIGEDVEAQLQPFHEFECTGENDEYVQDLDITENARANFKNETGIGFREFVDYYYGYKAVKFGEEPDKEDVHKYGYVLLDESGEVSKVFERTNPNAKWDWYQVGGRWQGLLKLKEGRTGEVGNLSPIAAFQGQTYEDETHCDSARIGDVDFAFMRKSVEDQAREEYSKAMEAIVSVNGSKTWKTWETAREEDGEIDQIRKDYLDQPEVKAIKKAFDSVWINADRFQMEESQYVKEAGDGAFVTYAVLKDGVWYEKGEMGWWGMASGEKEDSVWNEEFAKLIEGLSDDTLITVVDCHI